MNNLGFELVKSWKNREGNVNSNEEILNWISSRNKTLDVSIKPVDFSYDGFWYYDEETGCIKNKQDSFFKITGFRESEGDTVLSEQPVILQNEIGYLGIICKMIDGTLNFLMQAKIEPGNVNVVQLSPTLQATKSNFSRKHGGKTPNYLEYFLNTDKYEIIVDQIQSEQSSRFYKKRNRNIIILVDEDVSALDSHKWMTLGQIKTFMKIDNLVNMDTRTVISCLMFNDSESAENMQQTKTIIGEDEFYRSVFNAPDYDMIHKVFKHINDLRMFNSKEKQIVPLKELGNWEMKKESIECKYPFPFKVIFCKIDIEGREVRSWEQPLVKALGKSVFGTFTCIDEGIRKYLVRIKEEIGCFDTAELGPAVQMEPTHKEEALNSIERLLISKADKRENVIIDVIQSEEGGRFYHEENRNVIIEIDKREVGELPDDFFWMDFATVSEMIQFNNCVNIQLRNLISLIDF